MKVTDRDLGDDKFSCRRPLSHVDEEKRGSSATDPEVD